VLVVKKVANARARPRVDYPGVEVDDVYLFGCGMDYRGYWRGLPALYELASAKPRPVKKRSRLRQGRTWM
jgi:hypoxanthine phosphoribosyltransferase